MSYVEVEVAIAATFLIMSIGLILISPTNPKFSYYPAGGKVEVRGEK